MPFNPPNTGTHTASTGTGFFVLHADTAEAAWRRPGNGTGSYNGSASSSEFSAFSVPDSEGGECPSGHTGSYTGSDRSNDGDTGKGSHISCVFGTCTVSLHTAPAEISGIISAYPKWISVVFSW